MTYCKCGCGEVTPLASRTDKRYGLVEGMPTNFIHGLDEQQGQIDPRGLVICPSAKYHTLIHQRARAYDACGNANWRKCQHCQKYDNQSNLIFDGHSHFAHRSCRSLARKTTKGRAMLREIRPRLSGYEEFAEIASEIDKYMSGLNKERKAA